MILNVQMKGARICLLIKSYLFLKFGQELVNKRTVVAQTRDACSIDRQWGLAYQNDCKIIITFEQKKVKLKSQ